MALMVGISGVRGIVGESLTPPVLVRYAAAFAGYCRRNATGKPLIIVGRDGRFTGRTAGHLVSSTLIAAGADVHAIGICPTPTVSMAVRGCGAAGGISITASHNPMQWNGLKFFSADGFFLDAEAVAELRGLAAAGSSPFAPWDEWGEHHADETWLSRHVYRVVSSPHVDISLIQSRHFKVVVDCVNAAGGYVVPDLLRELGCEITELHCEVSGVFAHDPEPLPHNLTELRTRVAAEKADLGIAVDPDVDRLVFVTEKGEPFGEENTIALAVEHVLTKETARGRTPLPPVAVNLSTTRAVDDIARQHGTTVIRTPVGEANVVAAMRKAGSVVGGEGSGGVIVPSIHPGRDALTGIGLALEALAERKCTLSEMQARLPSYFIAKAKGEVDQAAAERGLVSLKKRYEGRAMADTRDGLRLDFPDYWVHLRRSNTEPVVRIFAEARTAEEAEGLAQRFMRELKQA
ncbi:MAG: phosphoglucosamine mutase [Bacteroidota bacterium]